MPKVLSGLLYLLLLAVVVSSSPTPRAVAQTLPPSEEEPVQGQAATDTTYYFYLVPWEWVTFETMTNPSGDSVTVRNPHWRAKYFDYVGLIDLRSKTQAACNGAQLTCVDRGYALAMYDQPLSAGITDAFYLTHWQSGTSGTIQPINRQDAAFALFRIPDFESSTIPLLVREIFRDYSDPDGSNAVRPLLPNERLVLTANIGPVRLFTDRISRSSTEWDKAKQSLQWEYERTRTNQGDEIALKRAGFWENKYSEDIRTDTQKTRDGATIEPQTTQTDDFDCADSDTFGCDLTWTEVASDWDIVSNQGTKTANADGRARADASVSGDDLYGQVTCSSVGDFQWCGVAARYDSSADTTYYYRRENTNNSHRLYKVETGTATLLTTATGDYLGAGSHSFTLKLEVNGSDLEGFEDATSEVTVTDTAITGFDMCGLYGFHSAPNYDNFTCEDLGGGTPTTRRVFIVVD